jgi:tRNA uridine 5-carbamoylmethylation protein Kti12
MQTICINFMGAPGVGKTTIAARVFSELKLSGHSAEWVGEYAKKLVYLGRFEELNNQYFVSSKQADLLDALQGRVRFVVTDGALAHGLYYNRHNPDNTSDVKKTHDAIMRRYKCHANINIMVVRGDFAYETAGRYQTEEQARAMDSKIADCMTECEIPFTSFTSDVAKVGELVESILALAKEQ